ncbi:MAG: [protein-PII] uridylyltransferase, partial [Alphaproteobacteria bacterium]
MSAPEGRPGGAATAERPAARPAAAPALPAALAPPEVPEPRLTPPPDAEILDPEALRAAIAAAAAAAAEPEARRRAVAQAAAEARQAGFARISAHLEADPWSAIWARGAYARLADAVIGALFEAARGPLAPEAAGSGTPFALLAVGGYGRAEMAPYSDIDLLVLSEAPLDAAAKATVETLLYLLWDMKLKVGHAARTIDEAIRFGREDHTIRTAMLEHRLIAGDETIARRFGQRFRRELVRGSRAEFIEAKLAERAERHRRQGAYRFMVEPNLKEGKGGLRDLQSLMWLTRFVYGIGTTAEMEERGLLRPDERALFDAAERFLWAVRCQLHLAAGRAVEQLTFDMQVEVARRLGYRDHGGRRAVEHFMQDYFRVATRVGDLTRILLTQLEARHVKRPPGVGGMLAEAGRRLRVRLRPGFRRREGRLDIRDPESFFADPVNILRLFDEGLRTGLLIHPEAMRQVQAHLHLIDDRMRRDPEAARIFFRLLLERGNPERSLRRMNELGVLGAYIPEFQPVVAMMQFNMYHRYTVDEHTIQCISVLAG